MTLAITARALITPTEKIEHPVVVVADGRIAAFGRREVVEVPAGAKQLELRDALLAPGYFDVHIHGGAGFDVMSASDSEMERIEQLLAKHGVTSYLPTTVTASVEATLKAVEKLGKRCGEQSGIAKARPAGIHLEGPFLSHAKRGVHPPEFLQKPCTRLFDQFVDAAQGAVRLITIAPEIEGATELIAHATKRGVKVTIGHSNAVAAEARKGIEAGAVSATHTFNAMRALEQREPGIAGVVLSDDRMMADLIADGVHVSPEMVKLWLRAKGPERAILISDALSATGMPDGKYKLGTFEFEVKGPLCTNNGVIAGSVLTLDRAVRNVCAFGEWPLEKAARLASFNPAKMIGIEKDCGHIAVGARADFVALNDRGEVLQTIIRGEAA